MVVGGKESGNIYDGNGNHNDGNFYFRGKRKGCLVSQTVVSGIFIHASSESVLRGCSGDCYFFYSEIMLMNAVMSSFDHHSSMIGLLMVINYYKSHLS